MSTDGERVCFMQEMLFFYPNAAGFITVVGSQNKNKAISDLLMSKAHIHALQSFYNNLFSVKYQQREHIRQRKNIKLLQIEPRFML